jgi:glycosyltransferase involved in cell wall biosynthesis
VRVLFLPDYSAANAYQRALSAGLADLGVEVRSDATRPGRVLPVAEAVLRHGRPGIVHVHWTEPYIARGERVSRVKARRTLLELRLARIAGSRIVWTAHDLFRHDRGVDPAERRFMRSLFRLSDAVIVHCQKAADSLLESLGVGGAAGAKVRVIPHGHYRGAYPDTITRADARQRLALPDEAMVVAFTGWVRPYKGVAELIDAFAQLEAADARLVVAGKPLDEAYAARLAAQAERDGRVSLRLGFVPDEDLQVYLRAADVVAAPFLEIFTSGSVLLAMSFERAVIAPRRGCVTETLDEGGGILYDPDDRHGLEGALRQAARADLEAMGRRNGERLERYGWDRVAEATRSVYEEVLAAR